MLLNKQLIKGLFYSAASPWEAETSYLSVQNFRGLSPQLKKIPHLLVTVFSNADSFNCPCFELFNSEISASTPLK